MGARRHTRGRRSTDGASVLAMVLMSAALVGCQVAPPERERDEAAEALARAFDARLTVWVEPDGERVHADHCRLAPGGCRARIDVFAELIADAAAEHDLDPFLLAGIAMRESGLDPSGVGPHGSHGILQLHPRGAGAGTELHRSEAHRRRCLRRTDACQAEIVDRGAEHLAEWIARCGDIPSALGGYNTGECGVTAYSRRVLAERNRLLSWSTLERSGDVPTLGAKNAP